MIKLNWHQNVAQIVLDRHETRNAFRIDDWRALADAISVISQAECTAVMLVSNAPRIFCSGSDITQLSLLADDLAMRAEFRMAMAAAIEGLAGLDVPVFAAIDGACFGAGVALALACDVRIAAPAASFCVPPAKLGISYPQSDIARLIGAIGPGQANRLLFIAEPIGAEEALRIGLVELLAASPRDEALRMCLQLSTYSPASIRSLKHGIRNAGSRNAQNLDEAFENLFGSDEFRRRTQKFRDGR